MKHKKILFGCIGASLSIHVLALCFFESYSLWFSTIPKQLYSNATIEKKQRDEFLKQTFSETRVIAKAPQKEASFAVMIAMTMPTEQSDSLTFEPIFPKSELASENEKHRFSLPESPQVDFLSSLPKELAIPPAEPTSMPSNSLPSISPFHFSLYSQSPQLTSSHFSFSTPIDPIPMEKNLVPIQVSQSIGFNPLPKIPSLEELETASYSEAFEAELTFTPYKDKYLFALTLLPKQGLDLPKIRQHFTFLIDRSNSIQQERLNATKSGVLKALEELSPEDTFNIIVFDNKIEKYSPGSVSATPENLAKAESFLDRIHLGSFFSSGDPSKPLFLTVPGMPKSDEMHTAILLTDGEALSKKGVQRAILNDWTLYNQGKVSLFPLAMDSDPQIDLLEAAAIFNKGKIVSSNSKKGLKRKILKLMKMVGTPVAKNISCKAISRSPNVKILLQSDASPHLYLNQPYIIIGETSSLDDFIIFVQGKLKDKWLNIQKTVSFLNAKKANKTLASEWAQHQAYALYAKDNDDRHLADARAIFESGSQ